jgi:hypothetical protein
MQFKIRTTRNEWVTVRAYATKRPGLVVHKQLNGDGWAVAHVGTTMSLTLTGHASIRTKAEALNYANWLGCLADWQFSVNHYGDRDAVEAAFAETNSGKEIRDIIDIALSNLRDPVQYRRILSGELFNDTDNI